MLDKERCTYSTFFEKTTRLVILSPCRVLSVDLNVGLLLLPRIFRCQDNVVKRAQDVVGEFMNLCPFQGKKHNPNHCEKYLFLDATRELSAQLPDDNFQSTPIGTLFLCRSDKRASSHSCVNYSCALLSLALLAKLNDKCMHA